MRTFLARLAAGGVLFFLLGGTALACRLTGYVKCDTTGEGVAGVVITATGTTYQLGPFQGSATTDADGFYSIDVGDYGTFTETIDFSQVPGGGSVVSPGTEVNVTMQSDTVVTNWVVTSASCTYAACWLTGGGAKFSALTGTLLAERGPQISFGGNVNPGCSPTAGDGGQWNHVDHGQKLHFQGTSIQVTSCGNVSGIPPGSTSPVTPYNFIEFKGTGKLNPLAGFKPSTPLPEVVCFTARAEDRNEPGSSGQRDGARIDRYFVRVTDCAGTTLLFLSQASLTNTTSDDATDDTPITITDGNLQIHISSCSQ
jgi:hypothetical protein